MIKIPVHFLHEYDKKAEFQIFLDTLACQTVIRGHIEKAGEIIKST